MEEYAQRVLEVVSRIPSGRVVAYGDIAKSLGEGGARNVGTVMSRYGSDVPWWRVIRADGRPPQGLETRAIEHWRAESTPMVRGLVDGARADMKQARWAIPTAAPTTSSRGGLHHVELWVSDLDAARREWGWLLPRLGYTLGDDWGHGFAYELGPLYLVVEAGPDVLPAPHERRRAGLNHLAFHAGARADVDALVESCADGGWSLMFAEKHPFAGGPDHYAAYLENTSGFEVELVAEHP